MKNSSPINKLAILAWALSLLAACSSTKQTNQPPTTAALEGTYWKLIELRGVPVTAAGDGKKEVFLTLTADGGRAHGFSGCNTFNGSYAVAEGSRINFSRTATTMMACANMETERQFLDVLSTADSYAIAGNTLSLNRSRMAPLAKFVAAVKP
jgi:heat shock protein HslJ